MKQRKFKHKKQDLQLRNKWWYLAGTLVPSYLSSIEMGDVAPSRSFSFQDTITVTIGINDAGTALYTRNGETVQLNADTIHPSPEGRAKMYAIAMELINGQT